MHLKSVWILFLCFCFNESTAAVNFVVFQIKVFHQFRMWKAFYVWKKNVRGKKFTDHKKQLNENLFIVNPVRASAKLTSATNPRRVENETQR